MQVATLKKTVHTRYAEEELEDFELDEKSLPSWFPIFRGWDDLEDSLNRAEENYRNGNCKPWDEAFADIKARYSA